MQPFYDANELSEVIDAINQHPFCDCVDLSQGQYTVILKGGPYLYNDKVVTTLRLPYDLNPLITVRSLRSMIEATRPLKKPYVVK